MEYNLRWLVGKFDQSTGPAVSAVRAVYMYLVAVNIPSVSDCRNSNNQCIIVDLIHHAIASNTDPPCVGAIFQLHTSIWAGMGG